MRRENEWIYFRSYYSQNDIYIIYIILYNFHWLVAVRIGGNCVSSNRTKWIEELSN